MAEIQNGVQDLNTTFDAFSIGESLANKMKRKSSLPGLKRIASAANLKTGAESRVMVFYTGGTIGMTQNDKDTLAPMPNALLKRIRQSPHLHDEVYAKQLFGAAATMGPFVLPEVQGNRNRIIYSITEYDPLLDSSNMTMDDWCMIANDIKQSYEFFDGFVILHGTDTLSYTASALSFMLENLGKPVIITGSQIPIFETRSDGRENFLSALILSGQYCIPEVCVFFGNKLYRGNRTSKISSASFCAFNSPNSPPIAEMGIYVEVDYRLIFRPCGIEKFSVHSTLNPNVGLLRIFPSISVATVRAFLSPPMEGVVLQTYGAGNVPSNRQDLMDELKAATERGLVIVNCTQCSQGAVSSRYKTGKDLLDVGVVPGSDMTPEAALTKLAYVLAKTEWNSETKRTMMQNNLRGELSCEKGPQLEDFDLVDAVARTLHLSSPQELHQLGAILFPAMVNSAVVAGNIQKLEVLKGYGANLAAVNYDQRTPLHVACCEGSVQVVKHLLLSGASVHIKDRYGRSPLQDAIEHDFMDIIRLLVRCGAHLTGSARAIGQHLCSAAERGLLQRLESFRVAGADLSQGDISGRTAAHMAAMHGHCDILHYLAKYVDLTEKDLLGMTPLDYAKRTEQMDAVKFLLGEPDRPLEIINGNNN